ncbi:Protein of unknown function [Micromonospora nigra]|uniref:Enediyne biosynthesis protein n=1 Tax=Micromonospora nigra TaxID=145857 RepID=A0A1C6SXS6_9ACTN|nr:DUF1702 family protein [Micromonospora nigra]SCL34394.1 Protein of unknown function [Micromonospora nigra]
MKAWRTLRRRVLTPDISQTKMSVRGFHVKDPDARDRLETVGASFIGGYAAAAEARSAAEAEAALSAMPAAFRGFGYEGAAMGFAMRDALPGGGRHVAELLRGGGDRHVYMAYVGVGWAMARLPRWRWSRLHAPDPLLRWLVLDGYGFHQAYFHTTRYVYLQHREDAFPWPADGPRAYRARVIDQGIGRATWFVAGTDPRRVVEIFGRFAADRWPDLYAGAGLAATYAGGASRAELEWFRDAAGPYAADLAQGSAFGAGARVRAGLVVPHNEVATDIFCGRSTAAAAAVTDAALVGLAADGDRPAYEVWRQRIRSTFVSARSNQSPLES